MLLVKNSLIENEVNSAYTIYIENQIKKEKYLPFGVVVPLRIDVYVLCVDVVP